MWKTRGQNCHICNAMAGRIYTYDTWISAGVLPGFHLNCNCYLSKVAVSAPVSSMDVFGSDFDIMLDNHNFLALNLNPAWIPTSRYMTDMIEKKQKETGLSIGETMKICRKTISLAISLLPSFPRGTSFSTGGFFAPCRSINPSMVPGRKNFPPRSPNPARSNPPRPITTVTFGSNI